MKVTVAILTFNGEEYLEEVLEAVLSQETGFEYDVLVIDSGSTDRTLEIVALHPEVRLHQIPNAEFGHGRTRNLAVSLSTDSDIVAFLTQDATPIGRGWLADLVGGFSYYDDCAAAYGKQLPRRRCCPPVKRDLTEVFAKGGLAEKSPLLFSNVNSAVRRDVVTEIPFRDIAYAEDRALAHDLTAAGWRVFHAYKSTVLHSHDLDLGDYFRRMYDEARGLRSAGLPVDDGVIRLAAATARGTVKDWMFIRRDAALRRTEKVTWLLKAPAYNVARRLAIRLSRSERVARGAANAFSLEHRRRSKAGP